MNVFSSLRAAILRGPADGVGPGSPTYAGRGRGRVVRRGRPRPRASGAEVGPHLLPPSSVSCGQTPLSAPPTTPAVGSPDVRRGRPRPRASGAEVGPQSFPAASVSCGQTPSSAPPTTPAVGSPVVRRGRPRPRASGAEVGPQSFLARLAVVPALILAVLLPPLSAAAFPPNPSFEQEGVAWTTVGDAQVSWPKGNRTAGARCLKLRGGWVISDPARPEDGVSGWQQLSFLARLESADAKLAVAFTDRAVGDSAPQLLLSRKALPPPRWHRVEVQMLAPRGHSAHLAFGSLGEGAWLIDDIRLEPHEPPAYDPVDDAPTLMEPLPVGWEPEGLLDARARVIADERELLVEVSGIEISMPDRVETNRAYRGGLRLYANNEGQVDKQLTIAVQAPPGFYVPARTVPIRGGGATVIDTSVQCLITGQYWLRIEFRCGDEVRAAPLQVQVGPSYPAFGAAWTGAAPLSTEQFQAAMTLPVQLHQVPFSSLDEGAEMVRLIPQGTDLAALLKPPWSAEECERAVAALGERASFFGLYHEQPTAQFDLAGELTASLAQAIQDAGLEARVLRAPLDLGADGKPLCSAEEMHALAGEGVAAAATLRLPPLQAPTVAGLQVDRRPSPEPLSRWVSLSECYDLSGTASALPGKHKDLPLVVSELCAQPSGSPLLDALALARVVSAVAYLDATALTAAARPADSPPGADALSLLTSAGDPRPAIAQVWAELTRELAGARPAVVLKGTDEISVSPGAPIGFRPFLRGDEGILALWNNTGAEVELAVEVRCVPLDLHTLEIGVGRIRKHYQGLFRFSQEAHWLRKPLIFVKLQPTQFDLLSMQLKDAHPAWLAGVDFKPFIPRPEKPRDDPFARTER